MKARFLLIAALFMAACQPVEDNTLIPDDVTPSGDTWTLTIQANMDNAGTKALSLEGTALSAYWDGTESVAVYKDGTKLVSLGVTVDQNDNKHATFSGEIPSASVAEGNTLTLLIPQETWNYTGQNGKLTGDGSIEKKYDYATATVTVNPITSGSPVTTTVANFENQQSIYCFTFSGTGITSLQDFTISSAKNGLVRQVAWGTATEEKGSITVTTSGSGPYYVALRNTSTEADTYSFTTTGTVNSNTDALLLGSKNIPVAALANGKYLTATINVTQPDFSPASGEISSSSAVL